MTGAGLLGNEHFSGQQSTSLIQVGRVPAASSWDRTEMERDVEEMRVVLLAVDLLAS